MTTAMLAQGWTITFDSSPVEEVTTFDLGVTAARLEVTNHDSPSGFREYIAGLFEGQPITFTKNHVDSDYSYEQAVGDSDNPGSLVMTSPTGAVYTVDAYVSGYTIHAPATGEAETADLEFTTTGPLARTGS